MAGPEKATPGVVGRADADQTQLADQIVPASQAADKGPLLQLVLPPPKDWPSRVMAYRPPDYLGGEPPPLQWHVEGWAQAGKAGVLAAAGGVGKTTIAIMLGCCHATGRLFLGRKVTRGKSLILSADDTQEDLEAVLALVVKAMHLTEFEVEMVRGNVTIVSLLGLDGVRAFSTTVAGVGIVETDMVFELQRATADLDHLVFVFIDTLRQFSGGSSNDEQIMRNIIGGCSEFAAAKGVYVVLAHHVGKGNYRDAVNDQYAATGSSVIADNARFVWLLMAVTWGEVSDKVKRTANEDGDPLVLMSTRGSLRVRAPDPVYMVRDGYSIRPIAGSVMSKDQQEDQKDIKVLQAVRGGAQTQSAVARVVRGRKATVLDRIEDLLQRGHLIDAGNGSGTGSASRLQVSATGARLLDSGC